MKKVLLIFLGALLFSSPVFAEELNGTAHDNGNGTFSITLQTEGGHLFTGKGVDQGDGTLLVTVKDSNGVTYRGLATSDEDDEYILSLNDLATGTPVGGILDVE